MDEQNSPSAGSSAQSPIYQESQEKNAKWLWLLIVLIIIGALVFAFFKGLGPFAQFSNGGEKTVSPTPEARIESSPEPSPEVKEVDRGEPGIRVLNGSGEAGIASSIKDFLEDLGWRVLSIGNAESYEFDSTTITFKEGFENFEDALVTDLSAKYSVKVSSDLLEASDEADIEVIVGTE
ncbi:hypothetical protein A3J17_00085 [Candidatus Curtissbacteria bacterium RIFCSPLOWO2_02_FULL_40_11]|uniref:LytR/CpsA/Psr regulator C-terminal domain-containing protein n=1 Tax=Candidatus Curtissbacteria bacterium RIFCSPHIGHO2_02_FULL_40_16b TaxID=1797714 RepID=A0A1F5G6G1_9BACT|nr:MAG: hypothetical protein A3D04_04105 [Candidatus Curtissbacteria bacterium RIFCSPHIGHO2_02_FULL_40_16b]OGD99539.1 MAG: hypothetical protein A3J17_00085 [Candidatus Curtissbacteria bacterium RIFCSPLOWO2_02_FULL_40_11]